MSGFLYLNKKIIRWLEKRHVSIIVRIPKFFLKTYRNLDIKFSIYLELKENGAFICHQTLNQFFNFKHFIHRLNKMFSFTVKKFFGIWSLRTGGYFIGGLHIFLYTLLMTISSNPDLSDGLKKHLDDLIDVIREDHPDYSYELCKLQ